MRWPWVSARAASIAVAQARARGWAEQLETDQTAVDDANAVVRDSLNALRLAHATIEEHQRRVPRLADVRVEAAHDVDGQALRRLAQWLRMRAAAMDDEARRSPSRSMEPPAQGIGPIAQ